MDINQQSLDLISDIYELALDQRSWTDVMDRSCVEAGAVAMNTLLVDHLHPEIQISATSSLFTEDDLQEFNQDHMEDESAAIMALSKYPAGAYMSDEQVFQDIGKTKAEISSTGWLRKKFGIDHRVAVRLNTGPAWLDCLTFHYAAERPFQTDQERARINILHPHFARVMEITRPFSLLRARFRAVLSVLDRFHIGTALLSEYGDVVISNYEARRIFSEGDGIKLTRDKKLSCHHSEDSDRLKLMISHVCGTSGAKANETGGLLSVARREGGDPYLVDVAPLKGTDELLESGFRGGLVLVTDPQNHQAISSDGLKMLYNLSDAEQAISALVIEGLKNNEIADSRNVSMDTIKSQLKSLYAKTGTSDRLQLLRLAQNINIPVDRAENEKKFS